MNVINQYISDDKSFWKGTDKIVYVLPSQLN